jgi:DNA-binding protein YbaB
MFDKLKQLKELRDLQKSIAKETLEVEKEGVKVRLNGNIEFEYIELNGGLEKEKQERVLRDCINDAVKHMQMKLAKRMGQLSGLGL